MIICDLCGEARDCLQKDGHAAPQIFGGSPGRSSSSCSSTALGGGNKTISRLIARPFPLSFCANGFQHSEQISYSLPSISFCRQSLASPHRSQIIMDFSQETLCNGSSLFPDKRLLPTFYKVRTLSGPSRITLRSEAGQRLGLILKGRDNVWQANHPQHSPHATPRTEQFQATALTAKGNICPDDGADARTIQLCHASQV